MCGIAGIFNFSSEMPSADTLKNMLGQIRHRGPDESGIYVDKNIGIGNVRLSIIDISTGQQPMSNDDKSLWIVYNGEVFNYIELRQDLLSRGIRFKTDSDTEVIVKCYELYKEKCLEMFNGQFAFAIWDSNKEELFLARDRMGIRPLYYSMHANRFIFGSEIKAILKSEMIPAEIDYKSLLQVFTFWTTITPNTCFRNIVEVPPGHYVKVSHKNIETKQYWTLKFPTDSQDYITDISEAIPQLDALFEDAVKIRLRADVPVAAYLSGGIDSSSTTYYIKKIAKDKLKTFSIGFTDKEYDETVYQNEVSEFLDTQHISFKCTNQNIAETFSDVIWHTEIPILRTAPVPMYLLSKNVRKHNIKVVVTGEGADEMLGGYNIFKEMCIRRFWSKYPDSQYRPLLLKKLYPYIPQLQSQNGKMLKFFFGYKLTDTDSLIYSHLLRWNNSSKISGYLSNNIQQMLKSYDPYSELTTIFNESYNKYSDLAKAQLIESKVFMSGYLLSSQGDRMAMANSVEGRYPFLDHRVVEYCAKLHPDLKLNGLNEKYLLKKMMKGRIPESVLERSKQAYRAPISGSFFGEHTPAYIQELLNPSSIKKTNIFEPAKVGSLLKKINTSPASELDNMALAAILSTQIVCNKFIHEDSSIKADMSDCRIIRNKQISNLE